MGNSQGSSAPWCCARRSLPYCTSFHSCKEGSPCSHICKECCRQSGGIFPLERTEGKTPLPRSARFGSANSRCIPFLFCLNCVVTKRAGTDALVSDCPVDVS